MTTARDLAAFHADRARLYDAIAVSLGGPPTALGLVGLRARLAGARPLRQEHRRVLAALDAATDETVQAEFNRLFRGAQALSLRCRGPSGDAIAASCVADIATLSRFAHETATAVAAGEILRAVHQTELQRRLLDDHAGSCLRSLAQSIAAREDCPFYRGLGVLLQELLVEDLAVFQAPGNP